MAGGSDDEATAFDLTALLDILSNIIFFLMASFGAAVVATIPAKIPTVSETESDVAAELEKVTVTMALNRTGQIEITAANNELLPDELAPLAKTIPGRDGEIDEEAVNQHLWTIKEKFRKSTDMILVPEPNVTYEMMVVAMDVARERKMVVDDEEVFPKLFPAVVVAAKAR